MGRRKGKRRPGRPSRHDLTPSVGAETDIAPLGRAASKPAHEQTANDEADGVDWSRAAALPEFRRLVAAKRAFIIPATLFFVIYYFALPILVGYAPDVMKRPVIGAVNLAYLFALSQFVMAWGLAAWYLRAAARFDTMSDGVIAAIERRSRG